MLYLISQYSQYCRWNRTTPVLAGIRAVPPSQGETLTCLSAHYFFLEAVHDDLGYPRLEWASCLSTLGLPRSRHVVISAVSVGCFCLQTVYAGFGLCLCLDLYEYWMDLCKLRVFAWLFSSCKLLLPALRSKGSHVCWCMRQKMYFINFCQWKRK